MWRFPKRVFDRTAGPSFREFGLIRQEIRARVLVALDGFHPSLPVEFAMRPEEFQDPESVKQTVFQKCGIRREKYEEIKFAVRGKDLDSSFEEIQSSLDESGAVEMRVYSPLNSQNPNRSKRLKSPEHVDIIDAPSTSRYTLFSFFKFVRLQDPKLFGERMEKILRRHRVLGRIYIAQEGFNGQACIPSDLSGTLQNAIDVEFEECHFKLNIDPKEFEMHGKDPENLPFTELNVRLKNTIVPDLSGADEVDYFSEDKCGKRLSPQEWHEFIQSNPEVSILDCRNYYETDIGKFHNAVPLNTSVFKSSDSAIQDIISNDPELGNSKPLLTYCTGGIRCVKIGAVLQQKYGLNQVYRLDGGIIAYARYLEELRKRNPSQPVRSVYHGSNFVFDQRLGESVTEEVVGKCDICKNPASTPLNCVNAMCSSLMLRCSACLALHNGCCCFQCRYMHLKTQKNSSSVNSINDYLTRYSQQYSMSEPAYLKSLRRAVKGRFPSAVDMMSDVFQGRALAMIGSLLGARRILELGTFAGYSALCLAESSENTEVVSVEKDRQMVAFAREQITQTPKAAQILLINDSVESFLTSLSTNQELLFQDESEQFDLIFLDADKKNYRKYYEILMSSNILRKNGVIIVDNVLWKSCVLDEMWNIEPGKFDRRGEAFIKNKNIEKTRLLTVEMHKFNEFVRDDIRSEQLILPIRDGLMVIKKK